MNDNKLLNCSDCEHCAMSGETVDRRHPETNEVITIPDDTHYCYVLPGHKVEIIEYHPETCENYKFCPERAYIIQMHYYGAPQVNVDAEIRKIIYPTRMIEEHSGYDFRGMGRRDFTFTIFTSHEKMIKILHSMEDDIVEHHNIFIEYIIYHFRVEPENNSC